ncbi:MAG: hypothetical protein AB8B55_14260 [Mariniblastus sp.]
MTPKTDLHDKNKNNSKAAGKSVLKTKRGQKNAGLSGGKRKSSGKLKTQSKNNPKVAKSKNIWPGVAIDVRSITKSFKLPRLFSDSPKSKNDTAKFSKSESPILWLANTDDFPGKWNDIVAWHRVGLKALGRKKDSKLKDKKQLGLRRLASQIFAAVDSYDLDSQNFADASRLLAACHWIRAIAGHCEYQDWSDCVTKILEISLAAESDVYLSPAIYQILALEVPLAIAFQVPEIEDYRGLGMRCAKKLSISIAEILDHDGWPHSRYLEEFGLLVASWVRCHAMMSKMDLELDGESAIQLEWLLRQVLRMLRSDGTVAFAPRGSRPITKLFLKFLKKISNDPSDKALIQLFSGKAKAKNSEKASVKASKANSIQRLSREIETSNVSEWAMSSLLRSQWELGSPRVAVDFASSCCRMEVGSKVELIAGNIMPSVSINGAELPIEIDFELVCDEQNEEVQYVEMEVELGTVPDKTATLTRQILLSRTEQFLLVADSIVPETDARIDYRCDWELCENISGMHESETREVYLKNDKIQALVLPLALPEWKVGRTDDRLSFENGKMSLVQSIDGSGLYAPLFFDLNPKRSKLKRTWRQLTVAEDLKIVPRDVACAFRMQLDKQQWFFYRFVSELGNRTFLGENFNGEFAFNRFDKKGTVTSLIQIENND